MRIGILAVAAMAASLGALVLLVAATRLSDMSASDPAIVLYLVFGDWNLRASLTVIGAALLAGSLAFVLLTRDAFVVRTAALRAAVLGLVVAGVMVGTVALGWLATTPDWQGQVADTRGWLTDRTPPEISINAPAVTVRGSATINITMRDDSASSVTLVTLDGQPLAAAEPLTIDTATLADGEHTVAVEAIDDSRQHNRAQATVVFRSETQWWMSDVTPPVITLTVPLTTVTGVAAVTLATSDQGEHHITRFTLDGMTLPVAPLVNVDTRNLSDGEHTIVVEAEDASRQHNKGQTNAVFRSDNNPPSVTVRMDPPVATQGHSQFIYVTVNEPVPGITATLGGQALTLVRGASSYWTVRGFEADAKTGSSLLSVRVVDGVGNATQVTATQVITRFIFPDEYITGDNVDLPPDKTALLSSGPAETIYLDSVFAPVTPEQLWQGQFVVPIRGTQTSPFAILRYYNGQPSDSRHGGLDIAADEGTPVPAANWGRVVLAEALKVRGHSVCLDHGLGVYTCYYHLSQIKVQMGQMVEKGKILGLVGSEGVSTGPHLHWEMRVSGKAVDPLPWTQRSYP